MALLSTAVPSLALKSRTNVRKGFMTGWRKAGDRLLKRRHEKELGQSSNTPAAAFQDAGEAELSSRLTKARQRYPSYHVHSRSFPQPSCAAPALGLVFTKSIPKN